VFDLFGATLGVFAGVAIYAVARHRFSIVRSLVAASTAYVVFVVGFTVWLDVALTGMG
jgi:hypothetical protein